MTKFPFLRAKHLRKTEGRAVDLIVIHTMEAPEKGTTAENVAQFFRNPTVRKNGILAEVKVSAHYCIDSNSVVQCVRDQDVAFAAPGANRTGLQFEHAGFARQKAADWGDPFSTAMLALSAGVVAHKVEQFNIPVQWLSPQDLTRRKRGITSHANVSEAFKKSDHTDPGPHFPVDRYLDLVRAELGVAPHPAPRQTHPLLQQGASGEAVRHLQRLLGGLEVDGDFGPITEARLRDWQVRLRLAESGVCDPETWAHLHPLLRQGDSGLIVQELQAALPGLVMDGDFGPKTEAALTTWQTEHQIAADGVVTTAVWKALLLQPE